MPRQSPLTHPRGRLPARVYWVRRGLVAVTAVALIFGFAQLFGGLGGSGGGNDTARLSADQQSPSAEASTASPGWTFPTTALSTAAAPESDSTSDADEDLASPDGPCSADDLSVEPTISHAYALRPVTIKLRLSGSSPACTFKLTPKSVAVKITSGKDHIWSTQDCPQGIKNRTVVVRSGHETKVSVNWGGHRSENGSCSVSNPWALPGYYHVTAAVLGSIPADSQFKLTAAPRDVITKTANPKDKKSGDKKSEDNKAGDKKSGDKNSGGKQKSDDGANGNGSKCGGDNAASSC